MVKSSLQSQRLMRNLTWLSAQELFTRLLGLATAIYLARTLSTSSYGELGIALAIVAIVGKLVQAGTGSRATRQTAVNPGAVPDIYAELTGFRLATATVFALLLLIATPVLSDVFSVAPALLMLASLLLFRRALTVVWAFRGLDQMHVNAFAETIEKALMLLGLVILVHGQGNDILWAPVVELAAGLLLIGWLRYRLGQIYPGLAIGFRVSAWKDITREALPIGLAGLLASFYMHGVVPLLGWLSSPDAAARFLVAQKIMLTLALLLWVINQAAFPAASRLLSSSAPGALDMLASLLRYYLLVITPIFLLVVLYANELLELLFGRAYADAGPVLIILLASLPFLALNSSILVLLRAIPKPGATLMSHIVGASVLVVLAFVLIPDRGADGAAWAIVAAEVTVSVVLLYLVTRAAGGMPFNWRCLSPLLAGMVAALTFQQSDMLTGVVRLALAGFVYIVIAFLTRAFTLEELRSLPHLLLAIARKPFS